MPQDTAINPLMKSAVKVSATDSTETDYAYTFPGVFTSAYTTKTLGSCVVFNAQTAVINFVGVGSDGQTFNCTIWGKVPISDANGNLTSHFYLQPLGVANLTLGNAGAYAGSSAFSSSYLFADTIVWTPSTTATTPVGNYTDLCAGLGANTGTVSNGANTPATLILALAGQCVELIFDFKMVSATSANAFVQTGAV